jgi:parvulin-like peptidyl-prolyl isomerase
MNEFQRAVAALEADRTEPLGLAETDALLDRMIDEELLVQRGVALGFLQHDRRIRSEVTSAVITSVVSETELREPDPQELRTFYDRNRDLFATPGRLRVRQIVLVNSEVGAGGGGDAAERAEAAARRLREGEPFDRVRAELGDEEAAVVPDALLPPTKLAEYLGAPVVRSIMGAKAGSVSGPWRSASGYHVVEIRERESTKIPSFEQIEQQVRDAYRRERGDAALSDYLAALRANSVILVRERSR